MSLVTSRDLSAAALATSAGGIAEMAPAAGVLNPKAAVTLGFHVVRAILLAGLSATLFHHFPRIGIIGAAQRPEVAIFGARRG